MGQRACGRSSEDEREDFAAFPETAQAQAERKDFTDAQPEQHGYSALDAVFEGMFYFVVAREAQRRGYDAKQGKEGAAHQDLDVATAETRQLVRNAVVQLLGE